MPPVVRVLLIEDHEEDYLLTRDLLLESQDTKFDLERASSYAEAVVALERRRHDVYLIDYNLGSHHGLDLLKRFASAPFPMIMLTGQDDRQIDLEAMRAGAMDYLVKGHIDAALLERSIRYSIARKRTEEALRRKDEFLAMLAHELRNPLAPIRTALHLLEMPEIGPAHAQQAKEVLHRQVEHLIRLVDDLLDISRIMQGRIELQKQPADLKSIVGHAMETAQPTIDAHGHKVDVTLPIDPVLIEADPVRLSQAISNLVINAAKYTEKGGHIWVTAARDGDDGIIRVRDSGVGIDPELLPHIFDLFVQGERSLARSQGGLGVGLTLVRRLVELHSGTVTASSAGRGKGSEFVVRIPGIKQPSTPDNDGELPGAQGDSRHVLVVDDNIDAAHCISVMLELKGFQVQVVHDGFAAVETARREKPEIILLDIGLPGRDGYEVAHILRADPQFANTKIIAVTGYGKDEDMRRSKAAGMDEHLVKPVDPDNLDQVLRLLHKTG